MVFPSSISNKMLSTRLERTGFKGGFSEESGGGSMPREPEGPSSHRLGEFPKIPLKRRRERPILEGIAALRCAALARP